MSTSTSEPAGTGPRPQAPYLAFIDVLGTARADADRANEARRTGRPLGAVTGMQKVDRELAGAFAPGLHFLGGNAGAGKTAFALQVATSCQCPALFVTCEMAPSELLRRHTARVTNTYLNRFKSGEMTGDDAEVLYRRAIEAAPQLAFLDATQAPASHQLVQDMGEATRGEAHHLLIVIDSLHAWAQGEFTGGGGTEYEMLNSAIFELQRISAALNCAVLIVSERNRASMEGGGLNGNAGTRKIEYSAETIIGLDRDKGAMQDAQGRVPVKMVFSKNRHGAAHKPIELFFNGALQTFSDGTGDN